MNESTLFNINPNDHIDSATLREMSLSELRSLVEEIRLKTADQTQELLKSRQRQEVLALRRKAFPSGLYNALAQKTPFSVTCKDTIYDHWNEWAKSNLYDYYPKRRVITRQDAKISSKVAVRLAFLPPPWSIEGHYENLFNWHLSKHPGLTINTKQAGDWRNALYAAKHHIEQGPLPTKQFAFVDDDRCKDSVKRFGHRTGCVFNFRRYALDAKERWFVQVGARRGSGCYWWRWPIDMHERVSSSLEEILIDIFYHEEKLKWTRKKDT